jgi:hypothetical protein
MLLKEVVGLPEMWHKWYSKISQLILESKPQMPTIKLNLPLILRKRRDYIIKHTQLEAKLVVKIYISLTRWSIQPKEIQWSKTTLD